jgi:hypothetical protein
LIAFLYAAWYISSPRNRQASRALLSSPAVFFVAYSLLCMTSALWSPKPTYSAFMAFQCLAYFMLVVAAVQEVNDRCAPQDVVEWTMLWVAWAVFWLVVRDVKWVGFGHLLYPFTSARLYTGMFFFWALYLSRRRSLSWLVAAFAILSVSNKNYFGILPAVFLAAILGDRKSKLLAFGLIGAGVFAIMSFGIEDVLQNTLFYGKEGVGWEHSTGRDKMWTLGWQLCMDRPLAGYGFVAGERDVLSSMMGQSAHGMHNMLLSAFVAVGFLGPLLLILYFLGVSVLCLAKSVPPMWRFVFSATVWMVLVISLMGPSLGGRVYGAWLSSVILMTVITGLCRRPDIQMGASQGAIMQTIAREWP